MKNIKNEALYRIKEELGQFSSEYDFYHDDTDYLDNYAYDDFISYNVNEKIKQLKLSVIKKDDLSLADFNKLNNEEKKSYYKKFILTYVKNPNVDKDVDFSIRKSLMLNYKSLTKNNIELEIYELLDINEEEHLFSIKERGGSFLVKVDLYSFSIWYKEDNHDDRSFFSLFSVIDDTNNVFKNVIYRNKCLSFDLKKEYEMFGFNEIKEVFNLLVSRQIEKEILRKKEYNYYYTPNIYFDKDEVISIINSFFREKKLNFKIDEINSICNTTSDVRRKRKI